MNKNIFNKRIAIVGTYCSGKTTLAEIISDKYNLKLSGDAFKLEIDQNFTGKSFNNLNDDEAMLIAVRAFKRRQKFERENTSFISDAGFISELAYYLSSINNEKPIFPSLIKNNLEHSEIYTDVLYLPMEIEFKQDNYRPNNLKLRKNIDDKIKEILNDKKISFTTISGSVSERVEMVEELLN